ncbi:MAG TPA: glycerol-3-phosphate dehydrogenase/oxidase [Candidatus Omnitrophota bacterium]|nr:glycerol-3-phosphate dehydrogenase/oxidase [Candidatus Omnitrophota bacterium]HOX09501.1 glycerol-3-phosphate dehydrogenase/oxidase [Candidatus Omnitrophota bacterium]HPN66628.1 glycerol-3-phosphate dehydrogenase/oxidase [Candidatus Omnitrophota bacterium]HRZ67109.1 glycerol-3-phosphate dehydrogenase/oxidase [Candidatus Omnitrophota bacterium]
MKRDIAGLKAGQFDLLVIGGGINGCAIARDASMRGLKTALIEKNDFACGASGNSTKIIHGGIRYLEQFNLNLVYEALHERGILLRTAPRLVRPLEFIIPVYKGDPRPLIMMRTGVFLYDMLAGRKNIHCHRSLDKSELSIFEPRITPKGLKGGVMYCDAQMDDARLCIANAVSASEEGCCISNKVEAQGFIKEHGRVAGAEVKDVLSGEAFVVRARCIVNATGAWSNKLVWADEPHAPAITRPTKGIHLIYKKLPITRAMLFSARKDKRIFFAIPWRDSTLIGTTDTDFEGSPDEVYAEKADVEYLLNEISRVFPDEKIGKDGVINTYAGLRPLMNTQGMAPWKVSREHYIKESGSGLISVVGGKYTTYRRLAEQVVDRALPVIGRGDLKKCATASKGPTHEVFTDREGGLRSRIERAVKNEMAVGLTDLLVRRLQLSMTPSRGLDVYEEAGRIMSELLGWTPAQRDLEVQSYKYEIRKNTACLS